MANNWVVAIVCTDLNTKVSLVANLLLNSLVSVAKSDSTGEISKKNSFRSFPLHAQSTFSFSYQLNVLNFRSHVQTLILWKQNETELLGSSPFTATPRLANDSSLEEQQTTGLSHLSTQNINGMPKWAAKKYKMR